MDRCRSCLSPSSIYLKSKQGEVSKLQASRLKITEGQLATIAGKSAGRKVLCTPQALPVFNALVSLAGSGNYWARLIVQGIRGLTSGRLHMDNIYVKKETNLAYGRGLFYVILPGVRATLEDCADGTFTLQTLQADLAYLQGQAENAKPGLWRVGGRGDKKRPQLIEDGSVLKKEYRPVVIADRTTDKPEDVARSVRNDLAKTDQTIKGIVEHSGFDLHYTPGKGGVVGLKSAKRALGSEQDKEMVESATLLANSMYRASRVPGVIWFADWGGSAVLTRALQILSNEKSVQFEKHRIVLNRPTTSSSLAVKLAKELNIELTEKKMGLTPKEIVGNHLHTDISWKGAFKTAVYGVSGAGAAFSIAGVGPTAAGLVGFAGAMYFVGSTVVSGAKSLTPKKYK